MELQGSMIDFETADVMDLEKADISEDLKAASCSICFDLVLDQGKRSIARLQCGHEFHLGDEFDLFFLNLTQFIAKLDLVPSW